jgi:hypothetical protein
MFLDTGGSKNFITRRARARTKKPEFNFILKLRVIF